MALTDILMGSNDLSKMISEIPLDTLHAPLDILTESKTRSGVPCNELKLVMEISQPFIF